MEDTRTDVTMLERNAFHCTNAIELWFCDTEYQAKSMPNA